MFASDKGVTSTLRALAWALVASSVAIPGIFRDVVAASSDSGSFALAIAVQTRTFTTMSYSDIRPLQRPEVGGEIEVGSRLGTSWWGVVTGYLGGAWFDFSGPTTSGTIEDLSWLIRVGLDRHFELGSRSAVYFGAGGQYGESRSWLDTYQTAEEGLRVFEGGAYFRAGANTQLRGASRVYLQLAQAAFRAHARQARLQNDFNWLGNSLEVSAGLRIVFGTGPTVE